jgi:hypothetical protein
MQAEEAEESPAPAASNPTNTPAGTGKRQVGSGTKHLHAFFREWMQRNLCKVLAAGSFSYRAEVRSGLSYPYKQVDNVVYLLDRPSKRYVIVELDPIEHKRNGLMEDLFRINWFCGERFGGQKVYVIRLNPSTYEHADGMLADPPLKDRLSRVLGLVRFLQQQAAGRDCGVVRCYFLYYSVARLQQFKSKVACQFVEVERDVLYCLSFRPHANPDYLKCD